MIDHSKEEKLFEADLCPVCMMCLDISVAHLMPVCRCNPVKVNIKHWYPGWLVGLITWYRIWRHNATR